MKNRNIAFTAILSVLGSFALCPSTHAVVPPPEGGYSGGNTALGASALLSLTTGTFNTAVGFLSLKSNTEGQFNTAVGAGALLANVGDPTAFEGVENTATGAGALLSNTTGEQNTANGVFALFTNTEGAGNTAIGASALLSNTNGGANTANGSSTLSNNSTGSFNTATGFAALNRNTTGNFNTANGSQALFSNATGGNNIAIGSNALFGNTEGVDNTAAGHQALLLNTTGSSNTAVGRNALSSNTTGSGNIALGVGAGSNVTDANNVIAIGHPGMNVDAGCFIGNIFGAQVGNDAVPVSIDSFGKLGTMTSSRRFKAEIKPMDKTSEAILSLKPVTFHYKSDKTNAPQFGLIAEEVAEVDSNLVVRDKEQKPYSVRYDRVNAMLLNEFLKEHKKIEDQDQRILMQKANIARQQKQIDALTSNLQKMAIQIEMSQSRSQIVLNR